MMQEIDNCCTDGYGEEANYVIRLRGIPYSATPDDIVAFFQETGCIIAGGTNGIHFVRRQNGLLTGDAFVELMSEDDMHLAWKKDKAYMGKRYIEVFESNRSEMDAAFNCGLMPEPIDRSRGLPYFSTEDLMRSFFSGFRGNLGGRGFHNMQGPRFTVHMRGLPYSSTEEHIRQFFAPLVPTYVEIDFNPNGKHSGYATVVFASAAEQKEAMKKDKAWMGTRYIELFADAALEHGRDGTTMTNRF